MPNPQLSLPVGVGVRPTVTISVLGMDDLLFTVDGDSIQVRARDTLGVIAALGTTGVGDVNFATPTHLACDLHTVYVNDDANARVKKHIDTTLAYDAQVTLASLAVPAMSNFAVDRHRLLMGEKATNTNVYFLNVNDLDADHAPFACGAGAVVGVCVTADHFFVATATRVEKRLKSDGTLLYTWNTLPVGFAVAGLTTDGDWVYALCTKAATDCKIVKLYAEDLFEYDVDDITAKQTPYAICCDDTYLYFTNVGDTTVNRMDNDLDPTSIVSVADITTPRGICCLPSYFSDLPVEAVDDFSVSAAAAMAGTAAVGRGSMFSVAGAMAMIGTAAISLVEGFAAAGAMAMTGAAATVKKVLTFAVSQAAAMTGSATIIKVSSLAATGSAAMAGTAVMGAGRATVGSFPAVQATVGSATAVAATVAW